MDHPVLAGHSIAGEELSSIGARHPGRVSGLIYLDAAYSYAYYSPELGDPIRDAMDLHRRLTTDLLRGFEDRNTPHGIGAASDRLARDLQSLERQRALMPPHPERPADSPPPPSIPLALSKGRAKYSQIQGPVLAIFADPHNFGSLYEDDPAAKAAVVENDRAATTAQADSFEAGVPQARVVRIAKADHFIFRSNEAEVMREMNMFLEKYERTPQGKRK